MERAQPADGVLCRTCEARPDRSSTEWGVSDPGNCPATRPRRGAAWGSLTPHVVMFRKARAQLV